MSLVFFMRSWGAVSRFSFFFSSRRRHTSSLCDWSSDVCSSDLRRSRRRLADLRQLRRLRPGLRPPPRRRRLLEGAARDGRAPAGVHRQAEGGRPGGHHRRSRLRSDLARLRPHARAYSDDLLRPRRQATGARHLRNLLRHRPDAGPSPRRQTTLERKQSVMTIITDFKRNEAVPLDLGWINHIHINKAAADRRAASLANRRTVKKEYQAAWLVKAIQVIDLTTLGGDDTPGRVERLCMKAMRPLRADLMAALGLTELSTGAVCVYHEMIKPAVQVIQGRLPIAAVSTGFPAGLTSMETKLREIELSVAAGATEIDIVITRQHVLNGNWQVLYDEMLAYRKACGEAHVKAILATGDLLTLENVAKASWVCMMAGADFIKTSTGKEGVNATIPVGLTMVRTIREYHEQTGFQVGFKPAGRQFGQERAAVPDPDEG